MNPKKILFPENRSKHQEVKGDFVMEDEVHYSKKKVEPKITRVSISLMGTGPDEGKSIQDIVRENPGGTLSIRPMKKKEQTQQSEQKENASPLTGNYPALVHQSLGHWRDYLPKKYQGVRGTGGLGPAGLREDHGGMGRPDRRVHEQQPGLGDDQGEVPVSPGGTRGGRGEHVPAAPGSAEAAETG